MDLFSLKLGFFYIIHPFIHRRPIPRSWKKTGKSVHYKCFDSTGSGSLPGSGRPPDSVDFSLDSGNLAIQTVTPSIMRVLYSPPGGPEYVSCSLDYHGHIPLHIEEKNRLIHIKPAGFSKKGPPQPVPGLDVLFDPESTEITFSFHRQILHSEVRAGSWKKGWVSSTKISPVREKYLGFGEKTGPLFKQNTKLKMWNTDDPHIGKNSDPLYQSCPFMIGLREDGFAHGIFFDNPSFSYFHLKNRKQSSRIFYAAREGPLCYYVIGGPSLKDVVYNFTLLTGRYPLPPFWALGHHHSRWLDSESAEKIKNCVGEFREHKVPCDVFHIDIGHMRGYRCFTWNPDTFPDPAGFIDTLHENKFKTVVISDPGIKKDPDFSLYKEGVEQGFFCTDKKGDVFHGPVWPGDCAFVDYSQPGAARWWGSLYTLYTKSGVDGFWNDMNEPSLFTLLRTLPDSVVHKGGEHLPPMEHRRLHNLYGLLMVKATSEGLAALRPGKRQFLFCRSSFAGIQRYASTWTGDNRSNWDHLRLSIPMLLNMGLSGQPMAGPDIGGFWGNTEPELMIRWMQVGAFYPFCRNHTSHNTIPQEVWKLGGQTLDVCRTYLSLRYTLIPYLYTWLWHASLTGIPLMRPLFLEYPSDSPCLDPAVCETEFLVGPSLLIAPVLSPGQVKREVYLPGGDSWIDFRTRKVYEGGRSYTCDAPLPVMPLFVKAGSVIPTAPPCLVTDDIKDSEIILSLYPSKNIFGTMYIDDRQSMSYKEGVYSLIVCEGEVSPGKMKVSIKRKEGSLVPVFGTHPRVILNICFVSPISNIKEVTLNGIPFTKRDGKQSGWELNDNTLGITITEPVLPFSIDILFE